MIIGNMERRTEFASRLQSKQYDVVSKRNFQDDHWQEVEVEMVFHLL